jgi:hypothetical protein
MQSNDMAQYVIAEADKREEIRNQLAVMPWSPLKMALVREESQRRLDAENQYPFLHCLTEAYHSIAHRTEFQHPDTEIEWLCSPWRQSIFGQPKSDDLVYAPAPSETDPMLQISDADPNSNDPSEQLD